MFHKKNKMIVQIGGMRCAHCAKKVEETLLKIENIEKVKIDLKKGCAIITVHGVVDIPKIKEEIENLDYIVNGIEEV